MVILLATGHRELGKCNSDELYKIIERIHPDTIFEEVPPSQFDSVYKGLLKDSLETHAIKKYLQTHPTPHFPVDLDTVERTDLPFKSDVRKMFNTFQQHNTEYAYLASQHSLKVEQHGFTYLNSNQCSELLARKYCIEEMMVDNNIQKELSVAHKKWMNFIDSRRNEMIKNIYLYAAQNKFENALFLVGAEHRKPIMDKIQDFEKTNNCKLMWNDNYFNLQ